jgi:lipopolysaccharide/colanic/teichoic acid biosynthesis glycosyltransferase
MFGQLQPSERRAVMAIGDAIAATAAVVLAIWTWTITAGVAMSPLVMRGYAWWFSFVPIWVMAMALNQVEGPYHAPKVLLSTLFRSSAWVLPCYLAAYFVGERDSLPRLIFLYAMWNACWLTLAVRAWAWWVLSRSQSQQRILVLSRHDTISDVRELFEQAGMGECKVEGFVSSVPPDAGGATHIVVATSDLPSTAIDELVQYQQRGVQVVDFARLYEDALHRIPIRHVEHSWVLTRLFSSSGLRSRSPMAKRALDLAGAGALLLLGAIPGVLVALLILADSGRPILYSQVRVGRGGRLFRITKFRTMWVDAEPNGPEWSRRQDPRVTRVGAWLRASHFDEWPNLCAVVRGDLSLVGPRPERPEFVTLLEREIPLYRARLAVVPGITGWAQVSSGYGDTLEEQAVKLEFDLYYAVNQSVWFDTVILLRTVGRILGMRGR